MTIAKLRTLAASSLLLLLLLIRKRASIRKRSYLVRRSLQHPRLSAWIRLYRAEDDGSFLATMGVDVQSFRTLLQNFRPVYDSFRRDRRGRSAHLTADDILGLTLHYINSTMKQKSLSEIFGIVPSACSDLLRKGRLALIICLRQMPSSEIVWPTERGKLEEYAQLIHRRQPGFRRLGYNPIGFVDGLNLAVSNDYKDSDIQNANWNGWLQQSVCSNLLVFSPTGEIIFCRLNGPGSWHDAMMAEPLYRCLEQLAETFCLIGDSAFPSTNALKDRILKPLKQGAVTDSNHVGVDSAAMMLTMHQLVLSVRQTAEWGNAALVGTCGRLQLPLHVESSRRLELLELCTRFYNFRVRHTGINQIRTVYVDGDESEFNFSNFYTTPAYDRVARFYNKV